MNRAVVMLAQRTLRQMDPARGVLAFGEWALCVPTGRLWIGTTSGDVEATYAGGNVNLAGAYACPALPDSHMLQGYTDGVAGQVFYCIREGWIYFCPADGAAFQPVHADVFNSTRVGRVS